jgi:hypothetical protein
MNFRSATSVFVTNARDYLERLRSTEGNELTEVDLHALRVQLRLLESEVSNRQYMVEKKATD